jgi:hypothetical protein
MVATIKKIERKLGCMKLTVNLIRKKVKETSKINKFVL